MNLKSESVFKLFLVAVTVSLVFAGYQDLNKNRYAEIEVVSFNDTTSSGYIDTVTVNVSNFEGRIKPVFFSISGDRNNYPWKSNVSIINETSVVKLEAPSPLATIRTKNFRFRVAEKGEPQLNSVSPPVTDFVCQPGVRDPFIRVWGFSIKVDQEVPFIWEPEWRHNINYTDLDKGVKINGEGKVLTQYTDYLPEELVFRAEGEKYSFEVHDSEGRVFHEEFTGSVNKTLNFSSYARRKDYVVVVRNSADELTVRQIGSGTCSKTIN